MLSPLDWPGVHCANPLMRGTPLLGVWIDRTAFCEARKRGGEEELSDFEEELELHFEPLPCWRHLEEGAWRGEVVELVRDIEAETLETHRQNGTVQVSQNSTGTPIWPRKAAVASAIGNDHLRHDSRRSASFDSISCRSSTMTS